MGTTFSSLFYKGSDDLDLTCDVCQHQNKTSIAVSYCETCEEVLCQTCHNVHRNQKLTRTHSLLTGDQLIDIKLVKQFREFGNVQDTSHVNDSVPGRKQGTSGPGGSGHYRGTCGQSGNGTGHKRATNRASGSVAGRMSGTSKDHGSVPGRVNYSDRDTDTVPSALDMTVSDIKHYDVGCKAVRSVVFMPSGHVVLACFEDGLQLLDTDFKQISQLSLYSVCACKVSDTEVLVAQGYMMQIQFVEVLPKMATKNALNIERLSRGVCYHNGEIYVMSDTEVLVMKKDGTVVRSLGYQYWMYIFRKNMFTMPVDVTVNNAGDKVFVTDWWTTSVTCMDQAGRVIYKYTDRDLKEPTGMLVDRQDNVLVTAWGSDNVHVINKEGKKHKIVLTWTDGLNGPECISYRHDDGLLAIGMCSSEGKSLMTVKTSLA